MTLGVAFRVNLGETPKSLFSHFRVTLKFSGFRGFGRAGFSSPKDVEGSAQTQMLASLLLFSCPKNKEKCVRAHLVAHLVLTPIALYPIAIVYRNMCFRYCSPIGLYPPKKPPTANSSCVCAPPCQGVGYSVPSCPPKSIGPYPQLGNEQNM